MRPATIDTWAPVICKEESFKRSKFKQDFAGLRALLYSAGKRQTRTFHRKTFVISYSKSHSVKTYHFVIFR